jgi:gentisate 1,2-dioxygenase
MAEFTMTDGAQRAALADELARYNVRVAQPGDRPLFTRVPQSDMQPLHWKAADLARLLDKIGEHLKLESGGQRRTLRLTNPGLPYGTTQTLWCSIQYILPNEIASCHRHSATALRFIMKGSGAHTTVDGERYDMNMGDLVLTPAMTWHDHEHLGDKPMVWLDVLDISLVRALDATFFEALDQDLQDVAPHPQKSFLEYGTGLMRPLSPRAETPLTPVPVYTWADSYDVLTRAAELDSDPHYDTAFEYQNPLTGGPALPTIGTALQRLRPGMQGRPYRHTGSTVYYVVRGSGQTKAGDQVFDWNEGDFIVIPSWVVQSHSNKSSDQEAILFQVNERPTLRTLGLYREEKL